MLNFGKSTVKFFSGFSISGRCGLWSVERTEVDFFTVRLNRSTPFVAVEPLKYSFVSRSVSAVYSSVLSVLKKCSFSNVCPPIVTRLVVFMVYLVRPFSGYYEPRESVREVGFFVYVNRAVAAASKTASYCTALCSFAVFYFPPQQAGSRVVSEKRPNVFCREVVARLRGTCFLGGSHSTLLKSSRSEAVESATNALLPRLRTTEAIA